MYSQTCAALSTAKGKAGIAVVRISGEQAFEIASKVFMPSYGKKFQELKPYRAYYGEILFEEEKIDTGLCICFPAPNSYTGENVVEISCHGSEVGVSLLLSALFKSGAIPAQPGEFTKRAFLNGKLKLTQAEAVAEIIDAQSEGALRLSAAKVWGRLTEKIDKLSESLTNILSSVYAYIDYPDEDLTDMPADEMKRQLLQIKDELMGLISSYDTGRAISQGIPAVITGSPNTGKSSFLNFLSKSSRAIVTDIAGTTRDVITEDIMIENLRFRLSDTAGIRQTDDPVEKIGIERSFEQIDEAEVVFALFDGSRELNNEDFLLIEKLKSLKDKYIVVIINKSDLEKNISEEKLNIFSKRLYFSTLTGEGYDCLTDVLQERYPGGDAEIRSGLIITSARQRSALLGSYNAIEQALSALDMFTPDVACMDIERAVSLIKETDGRSISEEVVNGIFSRFCVGK